VAGVSRNVSEIYSDEGTFTFRFEPLLEILPNYVLKVVLPSELEVKQNSSCGVSGKGLSPKVSCNADALLNTITIKDFLTNPLAKG
jgi:hypothetical protein